jgi:hypothetical protein
MLALKIQFLAQEPYYFVKKKTLFCSCKWTPKSCECWPTRRGPTCSPQKVPFCRRRLLRSVPAVSRDPDPADTEAAEAVTPGKTNLWPPVGQLARVPTPLRRTPVHPDPRDLQDDLVGRRHNFHFYECLLNVYVVLFR